MRSRLRRLERRPSDMLLLVKYTLLYGIVLMLVIYSFNSSKLVTVWAGWS